MIPILLLALLSVPAYAQETITLSMPRAEPIQVAAEVLKAAYAKLGVEVRIHAMPAQRALQDAVHGVVDGDVGRMVGLEKTFPSLVPVTVPVNSIDAVVFTCSPDVDIRSKADLARYRVGVRRGIRFAEKLTQGTPRTMCNSWNEAFDLLFIGRVDAVIASTRLMHEQRKRDATGCLRMLDPPLIHHSVLHYLNKRNKHLVPRIEAVLREMDATGESAAIRQQAINTFVH